MISDSRNITLYHASYTIIETVNLSYCKKRNDFGRGFYLIGSVGAIKTAIKTLKPERLQDQVCLKTESALAKLGFVEAFEVDVK